MGSVLLGFTRIALAFEPRSLVASRVAEGEIAIDGVADESAWVDAEWTTDFVQRSPLENHEPSEPTRVAVLFDSDALYVFVQANDSAPGRIRARLTRRDDLSPSDWIEVWLATQDTRRNGYRFALNPKGVQLDARLSDHGATQDIDWNARWQGASEVNADGWSAEFRIPFSALRSAESGRPWGLNVVRRIARFHEESVLSPTPKSASRPLRYMADVVGLEVTAKPSTIELWPYVSASARRDSEEHGVSLHAGGDANVALGANKSLHLTIRPDFGQVEADPSQLNLTAFEITFPEKRRFFLEGREFFQFPLSPGVSSNETLFYSRRIGAQPSRELDVPDTASIDYPNHVGILGAAKLVGREASGLSYAWLSALTQGEHARIRIGDTETAPRVAAPTLYSVGRFRKEYGAQAAWGGMFTDVHRDLGSELRPHYVRDAVGVASDFEIRRGSAGLMGNLAATYLAGSSEALTAVQRSSVHTFQRPDAHHLHYDEQRTSLAGWAAELTGGKLDGAPWRGRVRVLARSPGFNPNDLGYLRQADQQHAEIWLQRREDNPGPWHRYFHLATLAWVDKTFGPEVTGLGAMLNGYWELPDHSSTYWGVRRNQSALDVSLLRGGPAFQIPGKWDAWLGFGTDERRAADVDVEFWGLAGDESSLLRAVTTVSLNVRPSNALKFTLAPSLDQGRDDLQYVETDPLDHVILGRLLRTTASLTFRASLALTNRLHFDAYAMPYLTAGTYRQFFAVADPRAAHYRDRLAPTDYDGDRRFQVAQLRSNVQLRWENLHGAVIYLVWTREQTQSQSSVGTVRLDRDMGSLLTSAPVDVLMIKVLQVVSL